MVIFRKFTKWYLLDTYLFKSKFYAVQVRQNKKTGYKYFRCKRITSWRHADSTDSMSVKNIESKFNK